MSDSTEEGRKYGTPVDEFVAEGNRKAHIDQLNKAIDQVNQIALDLHKMGHQLEFVTGRLSRGSAFIAYAAGGSNES